jgi:hypothetical protein
MARDFEDLPFRNCCARLLTNSGGDLLDLPRSGLVSKCAGSLVDRECSEFLRSVRERRNQGLPGPGTVRGFPSGPITQPGASLMTRTEMCAILSV